MSRRKSSAPVKRRGSPAQIIFLVLTVIILLSFVLSLLVKV